MFPRPDQTLRPSISLIFLPFRPYNAIPAGSLTSEVFEGTPSFDEKTLYRGCFLTICIHSPHLFALNLSLRPTMCQCWLRSCTVEYCTLRVPARCSSRAHVTVRSIEPLPVARTVGAWPNTRMNFYNARSPSAISIKGPIIDFAFTFIARPCSRL